MRFTLLACFMLTACGVADLGTSAATTAELQAEQARQGRESQSQVTQKLDSASQAMEQRAAALDERKE